MAQLHICLNSKHEKLEPLIYHITYTNAGGINTYISNLKSGYPDEQSIVEIERGKESMTIHSLLKVANSKSILVLHDPAFCRHIVRGTWNVIALVLHGDNNYYYSAVEEFGQFADGLICVSENIQVNISARFQSKTITLGPSTAVPNCNLQARQKGDQVNLIFVAREDLNEGVQHLPSIDLILSEHDLEPRWTIVLGSRPDKVPSFRAWALENESRIDILENLPNRTIPHLIGQQDALILPSQTEGHPMVLIEALSQSVPPFSFYYSSHCETHLPVDDENIVAPSKNPEELAHRLIRHHQREKESLAKWQDSAAEFVQSHHNPATQAQLLSDFLTSLPRRRKSPLKQTFYKWKRRVLILLRSW